ncbi:ribonuclease H-like domain-containing protein [Tanacetum coccineum]
MDVANNFTLLRGLQALEFIQPPTSTRTTTTETPPDEWLTADSIVQSWIYITLSDSLLERVLKSKPTTAKDAWDALEKIFTDNKRSKNVELVGELRTLDIGDQTVDAYFRKINSIATRDPFPDLETVRSMVSLAESRINCNQGNSSASRISTSSPTVLMANTPSSRSAGNTSRPATSSTSTSICLNFSRGFCPYADRCKFVHGSVNNARVNYGQQNSSQWNTCHARPGLPLGQQIQAHVAQEGSTRQQSQSQQAASWATCESQATTLPEAFSTLILERFEDAGITKPNPKYNCRVSTIPPVPKYYIAAFNDPNWKIAVTYEYNALIKNGTWTLVPRPPDTKIVCSMWLFKHKYFADGPLSRYKARLVGNGRSQQIGVDYDETFSLKSLYGFKQAPQAWFQQFSSYATRVGFTHSRYDSSLFFIQQGSNSAYLLIYVDDIIVTTSSTSLLQRIISSLHQEFSMTDLGSLNYFVGISVLRDDTCMFLHQWQYALEVLERAGMLNCHPYRMPVDTECKLGADGVSVSDPTLYRSLAGALHYTPPHLALCNLLSWSSKFQVTLSRSSVEAEYRGVANVVAEIVWLRNLLRELHSPLKTATLVYCDNIMHMGGNRKWKFVMVPIHVTAPVSGHLQHSEMTLLPSTAEENICKRNDVRGSKVFLLMASAHWSNQRTFNFGAGFDWSDMAEEEIQANMALMAFSDSEVINDKSCSKSCVQNYEALKKQYDDLLVKLDDTCFKSSTYKRGHKEYLMRLLRIKLENVKEEKEGLEFIIAKFEKSSKDLDQLLASQITDKSKKGKNSFFCPANLKLASRIPKKARENNDAPIIEDWVSDDEDDVESIPKVEKKTVIPTATKKESVKPETPVRRTVSFDHIQYSCPNVHKHMVPRVVLMKTGLKTVNNANTVRSVNTTRPFSTARDFNTVRPSYTSHPKSTVHCARPKGTTFLNIKHSYQLF